MNRTLENVLYNNKANFHPLVDFNPLKDKVFHLDFTASNHELSSQVIADTNRFTTYINQTLEKNGSRYGIGGYNENRVLYKRSQLFETGESRSIHLGIDIWAPAGTKIYAPLGGTVHSFAYNDHFGDYGATIILQHQLDSLNFHTLYGHVSLSDLAPLQEGKYISRGEVMAHVGPAKENGDWPPHLHFQIIEDMNLKLGDYPGVSTPAESARYLHNCPDADLIVNMMKYVK
jgi:peptidoglycan LD-endopeptidase LytH